jgi:transportin-3
VFNDFFLGAVLTAFTDGLENLEVMLHVIQGYGEELPPACQNTCHDAWLVFDTFLSKYGANYDLSERATRVLRRGIDLFNKSALPVATSILARMSFAFESTGYPSFLWIAGKIIGRFGYEEDSNFRGAVNELFERSTSKVASLLQVKTPGEIPDGVPFFIHISIWYLRELFQSWRTTFRCCFNLYPLHPTYCLYRPRFLWHFGPR